MSEEVAETEQVSGELAELAASMGESELLNQVTAESNGEEYIAPETDDTDNYGNTVTDQMDQGEETQEDSDAGAEEETDSAEEEEKPWEINTDGPEILQSEEFTSFLESSGKTKEEFVKEILNGVTHTLKIRGREQQVSYEKMQAEAQIAGASRQKSQQMNQHIKNGMLIDAIKSGGEPGILALKQIIASAKDTLGHENIEDMIDNVLDAEGVYDDSGDITKAEKAAEIDQYLGDILDSPKYDDNMNVVRDDVANWLPQEVGKDISESFESLREYYDVVDSPGYPIVKQMVDDRLAALPEATSSQIRSNAAQFMGLFDAMSQEYAKSVMPNQPDGQPNALEQAQPQNPAGISKTVSPPRSKPGKRATNKQSSADNKDPLSMSGAELDAMLANYG